MATLRELIIKISAKFTVIPVGDSSGRPVWAVNITGPCRMADVRLLAAAREQRRALAELHSQLTEIRASAVGMTGAFAGAFATWTPDFAGG